MNVRIVASIFGVLAVWAGSGCLFLWHTLEKQNLEVSSLQAALDALSLPPPRAETTCAAGQESVLKESPKGAGQVSVPTEVSPRADVEIQNPRLAATDEGLVLFFDLFSTRPGVAAAGTIAIRGDLTRKDSSSLPAAAATERFRVANRVMKRVVLAKGEPTTWSGAQLDLVIKSEDGRTATVALPVLRTSSSAR